MKKGIPLRVVLSGFFVCFCIFIFGYERHSLKLQQQAVAEQARIIAASVWDLDLSHHQAYLFATAQHNGYKNITVTGDDGKILHAASTDIPGFADTALEKLGLIRRVTLQSPIVFKGQQIGRMTVVWLNKAIYGYANVLLLGVLFIIILLLYNRILRANEILEEKVAARTGELAAANRDVLVSRQLYGELIEKANSIILRWTADGTITFMNKFGLDFFGYAEAEIIGRNVVGTIVPETETSGRDLAAMIDDIARNPQKYINNENENICKSGRRVWVSWTNQALCDASGTACGIVSIGSDVTGRRLAEEKLHRSERLLREAQQISHTGSWTSDVRKNETYWSDEFFRMLGYEPGEVPPSFTTFVEHIHPDDHQILLERNTRDPADPALYTPQELRIVRRDGTVRYISANSSMHMDDAGQLVQVSGFMQDITELKQGEETLRESQERFARMAESIEEGLTIVEQGKIVYANDRVCDIFGISKELYIGRSIDPSVMALPEEKERLQNIWQQYLDTKRMPERISFWIETAGGERRYLQSRYTYRIWEGDTTACYILTTDETARKRAEDALQLSLEQLRGREQELEALNSQLQASNQQLRASRADLEYAYHFMDNIFHTSNDGLIMTDEKGYINRANIAALKILGCSAAAEVIGRHMAELGPQEEPYIGIAARAMSEMRENGFIHDLSTSLVRQDGSRCPVEFNGAYLRNDMDEIIGALVSIRDITERQRAENEIRASNEFLKTILKASPDIIIATDGQGVITMLSDTAEEVFGCSVDEVLGQSTAVLVGEDEENRQYALDMMGGFFSTGFIRNYEIPWKKKDGSVVHIEWNGLLLTDEEGNTTGSVGVIRNISSRKLLESQIRQAQKMESIGKLAGGIAHDFNNILTAIIGYTEMNLYHAEGNATVRHNSENVLKAAGRARDLVKQILTFSRPGDEDRKPVQVKPIISEACKMLRASLPASIDMQLFLVSESYVFAASTHLHQIIINLCTNASHALQERGGLLSVSLEDADIEAAADARLPDLLPGRYLKLTVTDTGSGISPTIIHRIFDPFFTTKESGKGTGMGLAMVYGIVKSYGGAITVASDVVRGSTFEVYLPRIQGAEAGVSLQEPEAPKGTERILFVDDEELIVEAGLAMLHTLGYDVVTANEPDRALEIFREHPGDFDLVITDYTMPNMNGFDLAGEIMRLRPGIPVMLCTGFSENMSPEKAQAAGIKAFVMKPFSRLEFAQAIRKAVEAGSA